MSGAGSGMAGRRHRAEPDRAEAITLCDRPDQWQRKDRDRKALGKGAGGEDEARSAGCAMGLSIRRHIAGDHLPDAVLSLTLSGPILKPVPTAMAEALKNRMPEADPEILPGESLPGMGTFAAAALPIRPELGPALDRGWAQLGEPGAWLSGAERVAAVREARAAWDCAVCRERKAALSPYAIDGPHDSATDLPDSWVDIVHRVVTDPGRLAERWCRSVRNAGVEEDEYVELVTVATIATVIDTFALAVGLPLPDLPAVRDGAPPRRREPTATPGPGWVATIAPENAGPGFADFYANDSHFYIRRSLTLLPDEARKFWDVMNPLYLADPRIRELDGLDRAIGRAQMEFLAARASMLLGCYY